LHIPWADVRSVSEFPSGTVGITVKNPFETRSKAGFVRRWWMGLGHLLLGQEKILIPTTLLGITKAELEERLDAHLLFFEVGELTQTLTEGAPG